MNYKLSDHSFTQNAVYCLTSSIARPHNQETAKHNRVQLIWVSGHKCNVANETADQLAKLGSECLFVGPHPACCISAGVAKKAVRD
jgi:hypothetical protein